IAVAEQNGAIVLLDPGSGREQRRLVSQPNAGSVRLEFSPDGRTLAVGSYRYDIRIASLVLWEVASGTVRQEFSGHEGMLTALAFSRDGRRLASGSWDTTVLLWDLGTSAQPARRLTAKELEEAWSGLDAADGKTAHAAMRQLLTAPAD